MDQKPLYFDWEGFPENRFETEILTKVRIYTKHPEIYFRKNRPQQDAAPIPEKSAVGKLIIGDIAISFGVKQILTPDKIPVPCLTFSVTEWNPNMMSPNCDTVTAKTICDFLRKSCQDIFKRDELCAMMDIPQLIDYPLAQAFPLFKDLIQRKLNEVVKKPYTAPLYGNSNNWQLSKIQNDFHGVAIVRNGEQPIGPCPIYISSTMAQSATFKEITNQYFLCIGYGNLRNAIPAAWHSKNSMSEEMTILMPNSIYASYSPLEVRKFLAAHYDELTECLERYYNLLEDGPLSGDSKWCPEPGSPEEFFICGFRERFETMSPETGRENRVVNSLISDMLSKQMCQQPKIIEILEEYHPRTVFYPPQSFATYTLDNAVRRMQRNASNSNISRR